MSDRFLWMYWKNMCTPRDFTFTVRTVLMKCVYYQDHSIKIYNAGIVNDDCIYAMIWIVSIVPHQQ